MSNVLVMMGHPLDDSYCAAMADKYTEGLESAGHETKRFNLGFFESVITDNSNKYGFNIEFFNPIIFYRAIEFSNGSNAGNALIGLDMKYQLTDNLFIYDQILIDEMTMGEVFSGDGWWGNKFGFQIGVKYFNAVVMSP